MTLLAARGLVKRFGGVLATDAVDLDLDAGRIHALIGPNGAGKTTLVAQLAGQLASDAGRVRFDGEDITQRVAHERAQRGLVRSFQITRLFSSFTVRGNVELALQAARRRVWHAWAPAAAHAGLRDAAQMLLAQIGLADRANDSVDALSHGERRMLEVGLALAGRPKLALLDEPMAGLGPDESARMEQLIAAMRGRTAVLLIEHDVDAVFRLADAVSVLVGGRIVASGDPETVRRDAGVVAAYLGDGSVG